MSDQPQRWIYFFGNGQADAGGDLKHLVGGKGASLADMTRAGLNVPPGFTISAECCRLYEQNNHEWPTDLEGQIRASLEHLERLAGRTFGRGGDPLLLAVRSGAAQSMPGMMDTILNVGLHPDNVRAIAQGTGQAKAAWQAYYHFLLMFSKTVSGTSDEALSQAKIDELDAGALEALCLRSGRPIPVDPWQQLVAAINAVFGSWHSERAVTYRQHHKIDNLLGTAVNVQMMCPAEVAGVMFTANPVNPALQQILIESSFGLGEAIVLGKVTPDRFVLDKSSLAIQERNIARKDYQVASLGQGEPGSVSPRSAHDEASLDDEQIMRLARLGQRVEEYFKTPCDIEWALARGQFFLLQARAIKVRETIDANDPEREKVRQEEIAALRAKADPEGTVWSRFNLAEILPEPTPMTWAIVNRFMSGQGGYGLMYRDLGFCPDPSLDDEGVFDLVCGRPYCNLSREPKMQYGKQPFAHDFATLKADPARALYPTAEFNSRKATLGFWLKFPWLALQQWWAESKRHRALATFATTFEQRIVPPFVAEVEAAWKEDWAKFSSPDLLARLHDWIRRTLTDFARESLKPTAIATIVMAEIEASFARRFQPDGVQTKPGELSGLQRARRALQELTMGARPSADVDLALGIQRWSEGVLTREEFLRHFGHRGKNEMELAQARWVEEPLSLMAFGKAATPHKVPGNADFEATWKRIAAEVRLARFQMPIMERELRSLHHLLGLREAGKHHMLRGYALVRRALVELDRRFGLDGGIFFLTLDELPGLVNSDNEAKSRADLDDVIRQRRRRRQLALSLPAPQVLFSDDLEAIGRDVEFTGQETLQGVPLSAGVAEGLAWVLHEATNSAPPGDGYILVCPSTDPAWVPLFINARGLVMETGGVLSHGAIVAREFGLPAVAGIPDVHRVLQTGQRLRIDGATGKVNVLAG